MQEKNIVKNKGKKNSTAAQKILNGCPVAQASCLVGDMWVLLIIRDLLKGSKRFNELQQSIISDLSKHAINSRTLTSRLKTLEKSGIIERAVFRHEMPPRVQYSLTAKGMALSRVIKMIRQYGQKYC